MYKDHICNWEVTSSLKYFVYYFFNKVKATEIKGKTNVKKLTECKNIWFQIIYCTLKNKFEKWILYEK